MSMSKSARKSILICLTPSLGPTWERGCMTYICLLYPSSSDTCNNHCKTHGLCEHVTFQMMLNSCGVASIDHVAFLRSGLNNLHLGKNAFTDALAKPLIQSMARLKNPLVTWPFSGPRSVQGLLGVEILLLQNISKVCICNDA